MPSKKKYVEESASEDDNNNSSDSDTKSMKKAKTDVKVFSNKILDPAKMPPKPTFVKSSKIEKPHDFCLTFTNGVLLRKFLEPAAHAVQKMRFLICHPKDKESFQGFKIECHDQAFTLADRGLFECNVTSSTNADGMILCVNAESFMEALVASTLKETDLRITRYTGSERITFESINNENDVRTVYSCAVLDSSQVDSLDGISINLGFHVNVQMSTLKELSLNAKRCGASSLSFDLYQAVDKDDPTIIHSKMCIGFQGTNTSGSHDFYISTRKMECENENDEMTWVPIKNAVGLDVLETLKMEKKCSNEYDNKKLRLFLNHMECQYVLVHLCTDNTTQPLVLDCIIGGVRTKHTVIVAPKENPSS